MSNPRTNKPLLIALYLNAALLALIALLMLTSRGGGATATEKTWRGVFWASAALVSSASKASTSRFSGSALQPAKARHTNAKAYLRLRINRISTLTRQPPHALPGCVEKPRTFYISKRPEVK